MMLSERLRLRLRRRANQRLTGETPSALRLVGGLALLVGVGTLALLLPGVGASGRLTLSEAMFTATSAASVTGLSVITPSTDLTLFGQAILLVLIQLGGVGFMALAVLTFWLLGRKVSLADRLALQESLGLALPRAILKIAGRSLLVVLAIEGLGALALWWHWRPLLGDQRALFYGLFHAVSAFCNAGFDLFAGLPGFPRGIPRDHTSLGILSVLIVAGGLGIPVWNDLFWRRGRLTLHSRVSLAAAATLILAGTFCIYVAERRPGGVLGNVPWPAGMFGAFFQSIAARTAGFSVLPSFSELTPATQWLISGLMFVGTAPASMGGGITTGTLAVLALSMWGYARGFPEARVGGRTIGRETVRRAIAILVVSLLLVGIATWVLLMTQRATMDQALFEVVSAFATTGLSLDFTGDLNWFGRLVIMGMMFWGRLGALTIFLALARQGRPQPVSYPEEQLLIG
jgi:trk system potassium uptake protein TrkH